MNKEQTQHGPAAPLVGLLSVCQSDAMHCKGQCRKRLLATSCYLITKLIMEMQRELHRKKKAKRERGEKRVKRVSLQVISNCMTVLHTVNRVTVRAEKIHRKKHDK